MLNAEESCPEFEEASVREMARKFELLLHSDRHQVDTGRRGEIQQTATHDRSSSREAKRLAAYHRRHTKPVKSQQNILTVTTTTATKTTTKIKKSNLHQSQAETAEIDDGTEHYDDDEENDDLLFDKLITDINIVINESTVRLPENADHAQRHSDGSVAESNHSSDDNEIYQNWNVEYHNSLLDTSSTNTSSNQPVDGYRVITELLEKERSYIATLSAGIDNYVLAPDADDRPSRATLGHIFDHIIVIRNFHQNTLLPALENSGMDAESFCASICRLIEDGYFYSYIAYAVNRRRARSLCEEHRPYFRRRAAEVNDTLGVEASFLMQPIQRIPKYQLLLYQLIQDLAKRLKGDGTNKRHIKLGSAACCRAEKHIQRLLDRMNDSMTIGDIVEFHTNLDFLLLNIANKSEFQMVDAFHIHDHARRRRYRGKLFLFDKCVVFTESEDRQTLRFRGFYQQAHVGVAFAEDRCRFYIYHMRRGNQEIECDTDADQQAVFKRWSEALNDMVLRSAGAVRKIE